jgi:hypothetical protein
VPKPIYAVIESLEFYMITCNGKKIRAKKDSWWLDKSFGKIDISLAAKQGENKITVNARPFTIFEEIAAIYILGDFRTEPNESGFVIVKDEPIQMGPWNKQGYSLYGDSVSYKQQFDIRQTGKKYFVRLGEWNGSVAKVAVNGKEAGYIWHQPWQYEVTDKIKKGKNDIEVIVTGTLKNTLGLHHTGQPGKVSPPEFRQAPQNSPPAGNKYKTIGYGLFEPFELVMQ